MSKSIMGSAIYMDDDAETVAQRVKDANCPPTEERNPILEYFKYLIYGALEVKLGGFDRFPSQGEKIFAIYEEMRDAYVTGELSVDELKQELITSLNILLTPVRAALISDENMKELHEYARSVSITR